MFQINPPHVDFDNRAGDCATGHITPVGAQYFNQIGNHGAGNHVNHNINRLAGGGAVHGLYQVLNATGDGGFGANCR